MSCLKPMDLFSDWQRSRHDKVMDNNSHIAKCKECSEAMALLDTAVCAFNAVSSTPTTDHLAPETIAAYVECNLDRNEREEVE